MQSWRQVKIQIWCSVWKKTCIQTLSDIKVGEFIIHSNEFELHLSTVCNNLAWWYLLRWHRCWNNVIILLACVMTARNSGEQWWKQFTTSMNEHKNLHVNTKVVTRASCKPGGMQSKWPVAAPFEHFRIRMIKQAVRSCVWQHIQAKPLQVLHELTKQMNSLGGNEFSHKFPDRWHWVKNCLEQWSGQVFWLFGWYLHEKSRKKASNNTVSHW